MTLLVQGREGVRYATVWNLHLKTLQEAAREIDNAILECKNKLPEKELPNIVPTFLISIFYMIIG